MTPRIHRAPAIVLSSAVLLLAFLSSEVWAQQPTGTKAEATPPSATAAASDTPAETNGAPTTVSVPGIDPKTGIPLYETIQEDWSSLAIGLSKLEPERPQVGEIAEKESFTRTLVQLKWRPGDPLDLYVILPKDAKKPPAVLYLYGYKDDTDFFKDDSWCQRATRGNVAAIGFVSALTASRFHDRPLEQWFVSELQESLGSTVHDVHFILDYLAQRGDIDMDRIGMFGQASGGAIAILSAAADSRIKAVDVLDPWGDWPVWLAQSPVANDDPKHANFTTPQFLAKVAPLEPVKWLPTLTSIRLRIQQVMDNGATPAASKDAVKAAAPKQAEVVRFDHLASLAQASGQGRLFDWIKAELKEPPTGIVGAEKQSTATARSPEAGKQLGLGDGH